MKIKELFKDPVMIFCILNLLDALFTYMALIKSTDSGELNPIYRILFDFFGIGAGLAFLKIIGVLCMAYIYYILIDKDKQYILTKAFKYINIVYVFIVLNNLYYVVFKS